MRRRGLRPARGSRGGVSVGHPPATRMRTAPEDLVRGLVLRDDRGRNAAALADLVTALLCPRPNFRATLAARATARATSAATCATRSTAGVFNILAELLAQILGVRGAHIDLIAGSVKGERNCLRSLGLTVVGKVTYDRHHRLLCHGGPALLLVVIYRLRTIYQDC